MGYFVMQLKNYDYNFSFISALRHCFLTNLIICQEAMANHEICQDGQREESHRFWCPFGIANSWKTQMVISFDFVDWPMFLAHRRGIIDPSNLIKKNNLTHLRVSEKKRVLIIGQTNNAVILKAFPFSDKEP